MEGVRTVRVWPQIPPRTIYSPAITVVCLLGFVFFSVFDTNSLCFLAVGLVLYIAILLSHWAVLITAETDIPSTIHSAITGTTRHIEHLVGRRRPPPRWWIYPFDRISAVCQQWGIGEIDFWPFVTEHELREYRRPGSSKWWRCASILFC